MKNQKQKQNIAIMIIIFIAIVFILFFIIFPTINQESVKDFSEKEKNLNQIEGFNESQTLALNTVKNSYQYQNYNPYNLELIGVSQIKNYNSWSFTYSFDINTSLLSNINSIEMSINVVDNDIQNITLTEKI